MSDVVGFRTSRDGTVALALAVGLHDGHRPGRQRAGAGRGVLQPGPDHHARPELHRPRHRDALPVEHLGERPERNGLRRQRDAERCHPPFEGDIEILLVSPAGGTRNLTLLSDAGTGSLSNATITFDDAAASPGPAELGVGARHVQAVQLHRAVRCPTPSRRRRRRRRRTPPWPAPSTASTATARGASTSSTTPAPTPGASGAAGRSTSPRSPPPAPARRSARR